MTFLEFAMQKPDSPLAHVVMWLPEHVRVKDLATLQKHVASYGTPRARTILEKGIKEYNDAITKILS